MSRNDEFVRETRASLRQLTNGLVELERDGSSRELVDEMFRTAHTLKGNCSMAGLDGASELAHALEDLLSSLRDGTLSPNPDLIDAGLAAVDDIGAILGEWNEHESVETAPDSSVSMLRAEMERYRDESGANTGATFSSPDTSNPPESMPADLEDEFDSSVVDALESASGFDDLEGLLAAMDDPDESEDEPDRWGRFEDAGENDEQGETGEPESSNEEAPATRFGRPPSVTDDFDDIKSDVNRDDISDLDRELVDVEFGEFDDDDELSIQDLVEGELTEEDPLAADDPADDGAADTEPGSSSPTDSPSAHDAIRPEDFGYAATGSGSTTDASPTVEADETAAPTDVVAADTEAENPFQGADIVDPDEATGDENVSAGVDMDESDASDVITADTFDFSTELAPIEDEESATPASDVQDDDIELSFPDGETFGPSDDETDETDETDENEEPASAEEPASIEEPTSAEEPVSTEESAPELEADESDLADEDFGLADDDFELTDDVSEIVEDGLTETEPSLSDDEFDLSDVASEGVTELDSTITDNSEESVAAATDDGQSAIDLPDVDLPDLDELTGSTLDTEFGDSDTAPSISFQRDEDTMAFESRFAERFGSVTDEDEVPLVQAAAGTIEESSLDSARYQSIGSVEYPLDFDDANQTDQIQSLTVDVQSADTLLNLVEELSLMQLRIKQGDEADIDDQLTAMESVTGELRRAVMNLRLMPLSTAIDGLPRVVRDIARRQDKQVAFEVDDEGVNLDRSIVEKLGDPLVHLVRNAVDHGIESPAERRQQNKSPEGTIELRAWRDRERVVIEVSDDGRGMSAERLRQQAIDHGIVSRERAERLSLDEVYDLVFEPGFSTAEEVTDVSGRGVGMDAVRRTINSIEGTVGITSDPGSGTTVRIRLPVSVAVAKMLFVGVGSEQYAIPASIVDDVELVEDDALADDGLVAVEWPDQTDRPDRIPYLHLDSVLGVETDNVDGDASDDARTASATGDDEMEDKRVLVRLDPDTRELAFLCNEVDDAREVVVKPYEKLLGDVPGISGATLSGDGTLVNIIDVTTI